jgi:hypothetical protein
MKNRWLRMFLFIAVIWGFASCYRPYGHRGYFDYYHYGRSHYRHGEHVRRVRGRAHHRVTARELRRDYHY